MLQDSTEPVRAQGGGLAEEVDCTQGTDDARKSMDAGSANMPKRASIRRMFALATRWEMFVFAVGVFGAMGSGLSQPVMILLWGELIDSVMAEKEIMDSLVQACWNMVILGAASMVFAALQQMCFKHFSDQQSLRYRGVYIDAVLHQDVAWFDLREAASLPTQMSFDGEKIAEAFSEKLGNSFMSGWSLLGGFVTGFLNGWQVALAALPAVPFMGLGAVLMTQALEQMQSETQGWYRKAAIVVEECLYAFRTVVSFGREKRELATFDNALEQARRGGVTNGFRQGASFGFTAMVMFLCYSSAFYVGALMMYHDVEHPFSGKPYTVGNVVSVLFCIMIGGFGIGTLLPGYTAFQEGRYSMGRYFDAADSKTTIERRSEDERADCPPVETLEISEVHFSYPARPSVKVLKGLSLKINKGQRVAIVGESGSGKSTVMALLERFYDPDSGVVLVNGIDMKTFAAKSLRRSFGYVGQEPVLFATSVKENILQGSIRSEGTDADLQRVVTEAELSFIKELPKGLDTYVGTGGSQFSGGQKQRIAIARALIKNTSVLFFDEATSALDNKSEKMIQRTIDRISAKAEGNLTMVSIAHRLSTIQNSDRIYVLLRGLVVESGTHDELVQSKGTYCALAAAQKVASKNEEEEEGNAACEEGPGSSSGLLAVQPNDQEALVAREDVPDLNCHVSHSTNPSMDPEAREAERVKKVAKEYKVPMARVMSFCRKEWIFIFPAVLCAILEGAAQPVTALLLSQAMDSLHDASKSSMRDAMELICILFAGFGVALLLVTVCEHGCMAIVSEALTKRLRVALLEQFFRQEIGFHDDPENTPAKLGQAVELWTYRISNLVKAWGGKSGALASIFVGLGLAFAYSWEMAVAMLLAVPVLSIASAIAMFIMMGGLRRSKEGNLQAQQVLSDSVQNARVCHACVNEEEIVSLYKSLIADANMGATRRAILSGLAIGFSTGVTYWIFAAGFYWAGSLVDRGEREFGDVMTAFLGVTYAAMGAAQCSMTLGDATKAKVAAHDVFKLLDRQTKIDSFEPEGETPSFANSKDVGLITFEAIRFRYPFRVDVEVLKGMSFTVQQGQAVGLVGPSGGGKSTVMAMIQRFYDPDEGAICIGPERKVLAKLNICWWRRQLGFVGQEPILFDTTVRANLMYGICEGEEVSDEWLETCARMANLAFLDDEPSRFETQVGPRGSRLSGGQKQRVAICRALIRNPPVLLFDEATSALDTQSEQIVQRALEVARQGRTSFSIAHRLSTIADCQLILVVSSGVIVEQGSHQELIEAGGVYSTLVQATDKQ